MRAGHTCGATATETEASSIRPSLTRTSLGFFGPLVCLHGPGNPSSIGCFDHLISLCIIPEFTPGHKIPRLQKGNNQLVTALYRWSKVATIIIQWSRYPGAAKWPGSPRLKPGPRRWSLDCIIWLLSREICTGMHHAPCTGKQTRGGDDVHRHM